MRPKRILIADDDASLVRILTVRLKQVGFAVTGTHDAMHALTLIHKDPPDLLVLDMNMPAGNGLAVCEMIKSDPRLNKIPAVMLTGAASKEIAQRCEEINVRYVLKSGHVWDKLKTLISELLGTEIFEAQP